MPRILIKRIVLPYFIILFLTAVVNRFWSKQATIIIPVLFIYTTFGLIYIFRQPSSKYGISFKGWAGSVKETAKLSLLVLIPFALLFKYLPLPGIRVETVHGFSFGLMLKLLCYQLLVVGPAEEIFFRGYLQTEIKALTKETSQAVLLIISAGLFALVHLVSRPYISSTLTFFPGILFAWLKEKTDGVLAPALFHGLCNLTFWILVTIK